jgi:hypothetical protein
VSGSAQACQTKPNARVNGEPCAGQRGGWRAGANRSDLSTGTRERPDARPARHGGYVRNSPAPPTRRLRLGAAGIALRRDEEVDARYAVLGRPGMEVSRSCLGSEGWPFRQLRSSGLPVDHSPRPQGVEVRATEPMSDRGRSAKSDSVGAFRNRIRKFYCWANLCRVIVGQSEDRLELASGKRGLADKMER